MVASKKGNTGDQMLALCERRLDNVIRRAGLTKTRPQARQGIVHGHFFVNGIKVTSPSYQLRPGDVITIRPNEPIYNLYKAWSATATASKRPTGSRSTPKRCGPRWSASPVPAISACRSMSTSWSSSWLASDVAGTLRVPLPANARLL